MNTCHMYLIYAFPETKGLRRPLLYLNILREHPFNLKGGELWFFVREQNSVGNFDWKKISVSEMGRKKYCFCRKKIISRKKNSVGNSFTASTIWLLHYQYVGNSFTASTIWLLHYQYVGNSFTSFIMDASTIWLLHYQYVGNSFTSFIMDASTIWLLHYQYDYCTTNMIIALPICW